MLLFCFGFCLVLETFTKNDIKMNETEDLEVVEGDNATLHCCWTDIERQKYPVNWTKDEVQIVHQPAVVTCDNGTCCATLTLHNVTRNHTGRYSCQLTIVRPIFMKLWGNGTMITVKERQSPTNGTMQKSMFSLTQRLVLFIFQTYILLKYQTSSSIPISDRIV